MSEENTIEPENINDRPPNFAHRRFFSFAAMSARQNADVRIMRLVSRRGNARGVAGTNRS